MSQEAVSLRNRYLVRIELEGISPVVWRSFEVDGSVTLSKLHEVIQIVMGWDNCHLHQFATGEAFYGVPDPDPEFDDGSVVDGSTVKLSQVLKASSDSLLYTYDFGDDWSHKLTLVEVLPYEKDKQAICIDGQRACPPENIGGIWGYEVLTDASNPDHKQYVELYGRSFDPEYIDLALINQQLSRKKL